MAESSFLTSEGLEAILQKIPHLKIGILGDLFLDRYLDLDAALTEPSLETGLDAYQVVNVRSTPGAAGTVLNNLASLGVGRIYPIAVLGDDGEGYELRQALHRLPAVDPSGLLVTADRRTPTYTKPMLYEKAGMARELNRLDIKNRMPLSENLEARIEKQVLALWPEIDALVVLDQVSEVNCGVVTERCRQRLAELAGRTPEKFVLADSRERIGLFRGVSIKPNRQETLQATGVDQSDGSDPLPRAATQLAALTGRWVFCTEGERGILLASAQAMGRSAPVRIPAYPVQGPIDIVGAGDSTSAALVCAMAAGASPEAAAVFGNLVASITIQQLGTTGTASPTQVRQRWKDVSG